MVNPTETKIRTIQKSKAYEVRDLEAEEVPLAETEEEAKRQVEDLLQTFLEPDPALKKLGRCNRPDGVRKELIKYLRTGLAYHLDFKHPTVKESFTNALVHQRLYELKEFYSKKPAGKTPRIQTYSSQIASIPTIRSSFLEYLKLYFPTGEPWRHPFSGKLYTNAYIREILKSYQTAFNGVNLLQYRSLWCLFTTQASRAFIVSNFNFDGNSVLRLWHDAIDGVMLLLEYPNLVPEKGKYRSEYEAFWCLISTRATRSAASEYFNLSDSSIKRLWNDMVDPLLLMLAYPDLPVEQAVLMYKNRG